MSSTRTRINNELRPEITVFKIWQHQANSEPSLISIYSFQSLWNLILQFQWNLGTIFNFPKHIFYPFVMFHFPMLSAISITSTFIMLDEIKREHWGALIEVIYYLVYTSTLSGTPWSGSSNKQCKSNYGRCNSREIGKMIIVLLSQEAAEKKSKKSLLIATPAMHWASNGNTDINL